MRAVQQADTAELALVALEHADEPATRDLGRAQHLGQHADADARHHGAQRSRELVHAEPRRERKPAATARPDERPCRDGLGGPRRDAVVAREILEESGVAVARVRYVASQPWPFPSQLMIACIAEAETEAITLDPNELEDAIWVSRAGVRAALDRLPDAPFLPPPSYAIAHTLLTAWVDGA